MSDYFGKYADFQTISKKDAGQLLGADNMIGDVLDIVCELDGGKHCAWLVNRFSKRIGMLDPSVSREISLAAAREMETRAVLSFVAFTDHPDEGHYWGQVAIICYAKSCEDAFGQFIKHVSKMMADGTRIAVNLGNDAIARIIESNGEWLPTQTISMPEKTKGTAIVKSRRSITDKLIETGRTGNKGCFVVSWVFLLALVTVLIFGLKSCFFSA
ncbi:hypothetical protein [Adlercreutzia sp. ZJ154]|uniref:hypothetical protein n=1 Tax=Adlercreutzia sp. ZJ154 TaxID=2709790 RepID=UPI0013EAFB21|nr:hypothetical protein [Adlercreutzia sp. ZJ154]